MYVRYYYDEPGVVSPVAQEAGFSPQMGVNITVGNPRKPNKDTTVLNYGPWAERQRDLFMKYFYPPDMMDQKACRQQASVC